MKFDLANYIINEEKQKKVLHKFEIFRIIIFSLFLNFIVGICIAQQKQDDDEIIRIETQLITVPVVVADKNGRPMLGLKKENFAIYEDEKRQEIAVFSLTDAPFEIALLLDTSGSTRNELSLIRRAALNFISSLRSDDKVAIVAFESTIKDDRQIAVSKVLTKLTSDRSKLEAALAEMKTSNGTPYYDALIKIANEVFDQESKENLLRRRAIVALTDGVDSVSLADFTEAAEKIQQKGLVTYFIQLDTRDFFEEGLLQDCQTATKFSAAQLRRYYAQFGSKSKVEKNFDFCSLGHFERLAISKKLYEIADYEMQKLAKESGGKVFPVSDINEARAAFKQIAEAIGTSYTLGYYPSNNKSDGSYRKIRVEIRGVPNVDLIRYREGYVATPPK